TAGLTRARIDIDYRGLKTHFSTVNRKEAPHLMDMELEEGPFDDLAGRWTFTPLGEEGCRVDFVLRYTLSSAAMGAVLSPVFGHIAGTLVDGFVARAEGKD
ncbi:MAG: type II toxin-antitoxin system RatA family toxin, partial [Usitatibacter sp.]